MRRLTDRDWFRGTCRAAVKVLESLYTFRLTKREEERVDVALAEIEDLTKERLRRYGKGKKDE